MGRKRRVQECPNCDNPNHKSGMTICIRCRKWHHWNCINWSPEVDSTPWMCEPCRLKPGMTLPSILPTEPILEEEEFEPNTLEYFGESNEALSSQFGLDLVTPGSKRDELWRLRMQEEIKSRVKEVTEMLMEEHRERLWSLQEQLSMKDEFLERCDRQGREQEARYKALEEQMKRLITTMQTVQVNSAIAPESVQQTVLPTVSTDTQRDAILQTNELLCIVNSDGDRNLSTRTVPKTTRFSYDKATREFDRLREEQENILKNSSSRHVNAANMEKVTDKQQCADGASEHLTSSETIVSQNLNQEPTVAEQQNRGRAYQVPLYSLSYSALPMYILSGISISCSDLAGGTTRQPPSSRIQSERPSVTEPMRLKPTTGDPQQIAGNSSQQKSTGCYQQRNFAGYDQPVPLAGTQFRFASDLQHVPFAGVLQSDFSDGHRRRNKYFSHHLSGDRLPESQFMSQIPMLQMPMPGIPMTQLPMPQKPMPGIPITQMPMPQMPTLQMPIPEMYMPGLSMPMPQMTMPQMTMPQMPMPQMPTLQMYMLGLSMPMPQMTMPQMPMIPPFTYPFMPYSGY